MEGHNTWVANRPDSLLVIPTGDVAQHAIANLCFFTQNGYCLYDDVNDRPIPGLEPFADIVDVANPLPLTLLDQYSLTECTAEPSTAAYAGMLSNKRWAWADGCSMALSPDKQVGQHIASFLRTSVARQW